MHNSYFIIHHKSIPITSKPMCVTNHNGTIIDHILTNSFHSKIDSGMLKIDMLNVTYQ